MENSFDQLKFESGVRALSFILSGAGLPTESGIPTFCGEDGSWKSK